MVRMEALRDRLTSERERIQQEIDAEAERRRIMSDAADQERYSNHPGDDGSDTFEREKSMAIQSNLEAMLGEIDHALHKFEAGTYGKCDNCGLEIPMERLEIRPQASLCVQCKSKDEHAAWAAHPQASPVF